MYLNKKLRSKKLDSPLSTPKESFVRGEKVPKSGAFVFPLKEATLPQVNASGFERERGMQFWCGD
jgi:hypothetical protein